MYSSDEEPDIKLRRHVDDLLLEYTREHIASDFVNHTESFVQEFFETLQPIPTHEKGQLLLAGDPFDTLKKRWNLGALEPPNESLVATGEALALLKQNLTLPKRPARSHTIWDEDDSDTSEHHYFRPGTPLLSRSSKEASKALLGRKRFDISVSDLPRKVSMHAVGEPRIEDAKLELADILTVKLEIGAEERQQMVSLAQSNPFLSRAQPLSSLGLPQSSIGFLRSRSPPLKPKFRDMSPPIFPRERPRGVHSNFADQNSAPRPSLSEMVIAHPEVPTSDGFDIAKANMAVVDGWTAVQRSSSQSNTTPTSSSDGSELDELDTELWLPSSSATSMAGSTNNIRFVNDIKMDVPLFPRVEKPGGGNVCFSEFMSSHSHPVSETVPKDLMAKIDSDRESSPFRTTASLSVLGQAASVSASSDVEDPAGTKLASSSFSQDLEANLENVRKLIGVPEATTFQGVIIKESLDEEGLTYMEVPVLPPPNAHCKQERVELYSHIPRLTKVTGLKSLNLELSWRPFEYGTSVPTHEDVSRAILAPEPAGDGPETYALIEEAVGTASDALCVWTTSDSNSQASPSDFRVYAIDPSNCNFYLSRSFDESQSLFLARSDRVAADTVVSTILSEETTSGIADNSPFYALSARSSESGSLQMFSAITPEIDADDLPALIHHTLHDNDTLTNDDGQNEYIVNDAKRRKLGFSPSAGYLDMDNCGELLTVNPKALSLHLPRGFDGSNAHQQINSPAFDFDSVLSQPTCYEDLRYPDPGIDEHGFVTEDPLPVDETRTQAPRSSTRILSHSHDVDEISKSRFPRPTDHVEAVPKPSAGQNSAELHTDGLLFKQFSASTFFHLMGKRAIPPTSSPEIHPAPFAEAATAKEVPSSPLPSGMIGDQESLNALLEEIRAFQIPPAHRNEECRTRSQQSYLTSLDVLQHTSLIRALESPACAVRIVVREQISQADVPISSAADVQADPESTLPSQAVQISFITSPHAAVILFPLAALPSQTQYSALLSSISRQSWSFTSILVLLTPFPSAHFTRSSAADVSFRPTVISPPIVKALRRVQRHLGIRDGTGEKNASCIVDVSIARNVDEAAGLVRAFGDKAISQIPLDIDLNIYLGEEEQEGERELAALECMNAYCAALILRCCTLDELLEMTPDERVSGLADLIGDERVEKLNTLLDERRAVIEVESSSFSTLSSDRFHGNNQ